MSIFRASTAFRRLTVRLLVTALATVSIGPLLHAADGHDVEAVLVIHDESQHHVSAEPHPDQVPVENHCIACHWVRVVRAPLGWDAVDVFFLQPGVLLPDNAPLRASASSRLPLPARAPPARV
ncbi:MAG: hypothetical protein AB7O67_07325 [Vicinamibacterales bacterium]